MVIFSFRILIICISQILMPDISDVVWELQSHSPLCNYCTDDNLEMLVDANDQWPRRQVTYLLQGCSRQNVSEYNVF